MYRLDCIEASWSALRKRSGPPGPREELLDQTTSKASRLAATMCARPSLMRNPEGVQGRSVALLLRKPHRAEFPYGTLDAWQ